MDKKLGIGFLKRCKMQPLMQDYAYFAFLFEKGCKKKYFMQAFRQDLYFVYLQKTKTLIRHLVAMETIFT